MLVERKKEIDELMDLFGDEYIDNNLVFCSSNEMCIRDRVELYPTCEAFYFQNCGKLFLAEDVRSHQIEGPDRFIRCLLYTSRCV